MCYPSPPYLWFSACVQHIRSFWYWWTSVFPNSFYAITGIPTKRTDFTRTAHYLDTIGTGGTSFSLHVHNNIAQNRWVYSTIKHRAGVVGNFFFLIPWDVHHDSPVFVFDLADFFPATFAAFLDAKFGGFIVLFFPYFYFFSDINRVQYRTGPKQSGRWFSR